MHDDLSEADIQVGDTIKWSSQSHGYYKEKAGVVIAIVPAGVDVRDVQHGLSAGFKLLDGPGMSRKRVSYLIAVAPKPGSNAKPQLYWPLTKTFTFWDRPSLNKLLESLPQSKTV